MMLKLPILCVAALLLSLLAGCAPHATAPYGRKPQGTFHVVQPGESLFRIAKAYDVSLEELLRVNRLKNAREIRPGQRIFVPGAKRQVPVELTTPTEQAIEPPTPEAHAGFIWPVNGRINSGFGPRGTTVHDGIDISAPEGTPIRVIEAGEVVYSDQLRGYGNLVIVRHADGFASVYAHNQTNLVREGQRVARGEIIAKVGATGRVSGPHLHFEIRKSNIAQDPLLYLPRLSRNP
jgi:murein DD-endopeptidase MepM/ murein hydrolase activator NlpD